MLSSVYWMTLKKLQVQVLDPDDLNKLYRLTPMTKPATVVNMLDVSNTATSTHSRVFGAYSADGINAALVEDNHVNNDFEDMYRQ